MMYASYCALFVALALPPSSAPASVETVAFQLTMPGLQEKSFYRGLLLATLDRAFSGRVRLHGVDRGWGPCRLFKAMPHSADVPSRLAGLRGSGTSK